MVIWGFWCHDTNLRIELWKNAEVIQMLRRSKARAIAVLVVIGESVGHRSGYALALAR